MTIEIKLLNESEVAELLSVSKACLRKWRLQNRGPAFIRLADGSAVRYPLGQLSDWVRTQPGGGSVIGPAKKGEAA